MISFTLPLRCMPKKRPRVFRNRVIMPRDYELWRESVKLYLRSKHPPLSTGPLAMSVLARYSKSRETDVDNGAGGILDSADGVLFANDRQVCALISIGIGQARTKHGMSDPPLPEIIAALRVLLDEMERADCGPDCTHVAAVDI